MSKVFSWEYFSFLNIDEAAAYKELMIVPVLLPLLFIVWIKLTGGYKADEVAKEGIDIKSAYHDALANEVDSGTELDSPDEAEEEKEEKEEKTEEKTEEEKEEKEEKTEEKTD